MDWNYYITKLTTRLRDNGNEMQRQDLFPFPSLGVCAWKRSSVTPHLKGEVNSCRIWHICRIPSTAASAQCSVVAVAWNWRQMMHWKMVAVDFCWIPIYTPHLKPCLQGVASLSHLNLDRCTSQNWIVMSPFHLKVIGQTQNPFVHGRDWLNSIQ